MIERHGVMQNRVKGFVETGEGLTGSRSEFVVRASVRQASPFSIL